MTSVGETLRRERLRKELNLEEISRETKISARMLDAIEKDRFETLPGGVFAKSFVRQYARFLGLDEEEMAAELEKVIRPVGELPSFAEAPATPTFKVPRMVDWEGSRSKSSVLPALAMVVAVMLVCSAVYAWWQRGRRPGSAPAATVTAQKPPSSPPKPQESVPAAVPAASNPDTTAQTEVAATATPTAGQAQDRPAAIPSDNPAATLRVSLTAGADAWVQISVDGKTVMSAVLHPNEVKNVAAVDDLRIRTGNAGDLQVSVNGKPAGSLGPKGQVRVLEVTRAGFHIVPPPPKPAPALDPL